MSTGKEKITVDLRNTYKRLKFWNGIFDMTDEEIGILVALLDSDGELCATDNRAQACVNAGVSKAVMNTYIKRIKEKNALKHVEGKYVLNRMLQRRGSLEITFLGGT